MSRPTPFDDWSRRTGERLARYVRERLGVRGIRLGYNPNSSSLGVHASLLIYGTLALAVAAPPIALLVRALAAWGADKPVPPPAPRSADAAPRPDEATETQP